MHSGGGIVCVSASETDCKPFAVVEDLQKKRTLPGFGPSRTRKNHIQHDPADVRKQQGGLEPNSFQLVSGFNLHQECRRGQVGGTYQPHQMDK